MKHRINFGCIIKLLIVLALLMGVLFIFLTCSGGSCIQRIDKTLPSITSAPWEVMTPTHLYYSQNATETKTGVLITNWYEKSNGKWVYHKGQIELPFRIYGKNIKMNRR